MAGTLDLIRDWATELDYWEQAALENVAADTAVSEEDHQRLLDLCMQDAGLIAMPKAARPKLNFPTKLDDSGTATGYMVERLFDLDSVNALPEGQEVRFGSHLTVVYGPNGAGKTSYIRPLGCAAFARGEREVLSDARKAGTSAVPTASVEISKNGTKKIVTWRYGSRCSELSGVYVFDSASVTAHLTKPNSLSFSPAGLSLLTRLAEVTDEVRDRLRNVIEAKSIAHNFGPQFPGESSIQREITALNVKTDVGALEKRAALTELDEQRIAALDKLIAELKSRNVPNRIAVLRQEVRDLQNLLTNIKAAETSVAASVEAEVKALVEEAVARKAEAERVGADQFKFEQFRQIGTEVWREFIAAAKALADAEAQRGKPYPQNGDSCLFCRQTLSPEALGLVNRMWEFLGSDAPARYEAAQQACRRRARAINISLAFFGPDNPARRILTSEAATAVTAIDGYLKECSTRIQDLQSALTDGSLKAFSGAAKPDLSAINLAIEQRTSKIDKLQNADTDKELKALEDEQRELLHRRTLRDRLPEIKAWIDSQQWAVRAHRALGSTRHITAKYNELFKLLVTDQYRDTFQSILHKLKRNLKLTIETRGQKGETVRQIVLSPEVFAQKVAIEKILSDGEKHAVALADFITEVSLDASSTAIVLDDPVSSFDSDSKDAVAKLLAEISAQRQVIIFTHDLAFVYALKLAAKQLSVGVTSHWIRSESGEPGYVYLDNSPICEGDYKSAKIARDCYSKAKAAPPAEQERLLQQGFGALRTTYEAFIIYDLFNAVVKRFEERVAFDQLKDVHLDRGVVDKVVEKLGTLSRHIDAHLHSDTFAADKPTPEMLLEEVETFEDLKRKHKEAKKPFASADPKPVAKAVAATAKAATPGASQPNANATSSVN